MGSYRPPPPPRVFPVIPGIFRFQHYMWYPRSCELPIYSWFLTFIFPNVRGPHWMSKSRLWLIVFVRSSSVPLFAEKLLINIFIKHYFRMCLNVNWASYSSLFRLFLREWNVWFAEFMSKQNKKGVSRASPILNIGEHPPKENGFAITIPSL